MEQSEELLSIDYVPGALYNFISFNPHIIISSLTCEKVKVERYLLILPKLVNKM